MNFLKLYIFSPLLISLVSGAAITNNVTHTKEILPLHNNNPLDSSSSCGGKLLASDGTISYKNFSPYSPNERCVWTVRAPNATSYSVNLDSLGASGTLSITGFGLIDLELHNLPRAAANISMANSNVLVIVFFTGSASNTNNYPGFSLRYSASTSGTNPKASVTSEDIIVPANAGHIKYPSSGSSYGNFDLSLIVVTPFLTTPISQKTELIYIRNGLEGQSCQDKVIVYAFSASQSTTKWKRLGRMCGGIDSEVIASQDIILLKFESDSSDVSSGFHLYSRNVN